MGGKGGPAPQIVGIAVGLVFTERVVVPMVYRLKLTSINDVGDGHRGGGGGGVKAVGGGGGGSCPTYCRYGGRAGLHRACGGADGLQTEADQHQ